jgi:hypothetical protein
MMSFPTAGNQRRRFIFASRSFAVPFQIEKRCGGFGAALN